MLTCIATGRTTRALVGFRAWGMISGIKRVIRAATDKRIDRATHMAKKPIRKPASGEKKSKPKKRPVESYDHKGKKRANNPPVGLVTPDTDPDHGKKTTYEYDPHLDPQLVWAGKAEHTSFEVPTVSLHVHERIDPRTIIAAVRRNGGSGQRIVDSGQQQMLLFEQPEQKRPRTSTRPTGRGSRCSRCR